jgi:hypothetical protein
VVAERFLVVSGALLLLPLACSSGTREGGADSGNASSSTGSSGFDASVDSGGSLGLDAGVDGTVSPGLDANVFDRDADEGGTASDGSAPDAIGVLLGMDGQDADTTLVLPESLSVIPLAGGNGVLDMIALTLRSGSSGTEIYAALRNDDVSVEACDPGLSVALYDKTGQPMGTWIGSLNTIHSYQVPDSGDIASCVGPGDVTMAALTGLPADLVIDDVGTIVYRCVYFAMDDITPIDGVVVSQLASVTMDGGTAFTGTLVNDFDAAVSTPSVTVFPVTPAGRPLAVAISIGDAGDVDAGGSWAFQTSAVDVPVASYVAYPTAAFPQ